MNVNLERGVEPCYLLSWKNNNTQLIVETCNGAPYMCGKENAGQTLMKKDFLYAHYVHQAYLVLLQALFCITKTRLFSDASGPVLYNQDKTI